jgi:hypothetical protein
MLKFIKEYRVDEYINSSTTKHDGPSYWTCDARLGEQKFYGVVEADAARDLGLRGWPEGRKLIEQIKSQIDGRLGTTNRQYVPVHDVSGAYVDVGRFCEGVPECMLTFEESEAPQSGFVWVHISCGVSAVVSSQQIQLQGAVVGALVDSLESLGQRVKLTWERSSRNDHGTRQITLWMTLKEYDEPLDLDRIAFFLTHNAPRRIMAWEEYLKAPQAFVDALDVAPCSAGCHPTTDDKLSKEADIVMTNIEFSDPGQAVEWLLAELETLGVKIEA